MTTTYTGDPTVSTVAWIRFKIQDTGPVYGVDPFHFQDEEITSQLSDDGGNQWMAAGHLLQTWAIDLAQNPNFRIGRFSEDWSGAAAELNKKALELLTSPQATGVGAFVGAVSVSDKDTRHSNTDRTRGAFRRGMMDNPDAGWS